MSLLSIADLEPAQLAQLTELGANVKADPDAFRTALAGRAVGLFFMKQSLRTWVSCDVAAIQLGAHPVAIRNEQTGLGTREEPEDVARVLHRYLDALGMRVYDHHDLEAIAAAAPIPVINLLSDREHPCQALADVLTIAERRSLSDSTVAYVGDGNNVCHSLMLAVPMLGGRMRIAAPEGYQPDPQLVAAARRHGEVELVTEPEPAVEGAHVVYTDVWASMGHEDEAEERRRRFLPFQVDTELFGRAAPDALFLHCLPAHRGEEVTAEVLEHPRSVVFDQAENRLHSFKALLLHLLA